MMNSPGNQRGALMIEVLITIVICIIGLWGMREVQMRLQASELESYQRSQALILLDDIYTRMQLNQHQAASYVTGTNETSVIKTTACPTASSTWADNDLAAWCAQMQISSELESDDSQVGGLLGARGCVEQVDNDEYMLSVAWQGLVAAGVPPASAACGLGQYDDGNTCTGDQCRRIVTTVLRIGDLSTW